MLPYFDTIHLVCCQHHINHGSLEKKLRVQGRAIHSCGSLRRTGRSDIILTSDATTIHAARVEVALRLHLATVANILIFYVGRNSRMNRPFVQVFVWLGIVSIIVKLRNKEH